MKNKELELLLRNHGFLSCIPLIEVCETDKNIKEIEVDKVQDFTSSKYLNSYIRQYLDSLNIKVKEVDMKKRLEQFNTSVIPEDPPKPNTCQNVVHKPFKRNLSKEKKIEMYNNYKMNMFKIDNETFVICPQCSNFEKL